MCIVDQTIMAAHVIFLLSTLPRCVDLIDMGMTVNTVFIVAQKALSEKVAYLAQTDIIAYKGVKE